MRELRIARVLFAVVCVALLLLCSASSPSAAHPDLAPPPLVFCFFVVLVLSLPRIPDRRPAVQPISFLSVLASRAPPAA